MSQWIGVDIVLDIWLTVVDLLRKNFLGRVPGVETSIVCSCRSLPVAQSTCYSMPGHCLRQRAKHEKQERANILSLKQELARQVSQETRRQAGEADTENDTDVQV